VSGYTANDVTWRFMAAQGQHLALIKMKFGSEERTMDAVLRAIFLFVFGKRVGVGAPKI